MKFCRRVAVSSPTDMPRKHASSTMLVKKVRKTTVEPNHRIAASAKKRIKKLIRNGSTCGRRGLSSVMIGRSSIGAAIASVVAVEGSMRCGIVMANVELTQFHGHPNRSDRSGHHDPEGRCHRQ